MQHLLGSYGGGGGVGPDGADRSSGGSGAVPDGARRGDCSEGRSAGGTAEPGSVQGATGAPLLARLGGGGRVALVCLQFSDPPVRRQALVGGGELVAQLAEALPTGALVWIQSDVLSIATSLRRLFWRHGGFAPSARHAAATSATITRLWMPPQDMRAHPSGPPTATSSPGASKSGETSSAASPPPARSGVPRPAPDVGEEAGGPPADGPAAVAATAAAAAVGLPLLLRGVDLRSHQEPRLTETQVAAVAAVRKGTAHDPDDRCAGGHTASVCSPPAVRADGAWQCREDQEHVELRGVAGDWDEATHGDGAADALPGGWDPSRGDNCCEPDGGGGADGWEGLPWLDVNPLGVPTERELYVERGGRPIYRLLLVRT
ncbi:hypothetical protein GPECTOR_18g80 [Gonium pectorale]|uniref:tRNA (guanine(46)-N(7))-methyltransferase n=1 Tax=Gonium pectorale TaxID=33097 RepID=A0A150GK72_GONPE|nr:hypothetical protein GPECTOR_18g80 [Gonium pectorale]|eukprot:KXZ50105.1 hypothetical protein GPECTOR_18g80 [Gonium pectorale]